MLSSLNNNSISALGDNYVKFANGLMIQWGRVDSPSSGSGGKGYATVTFPQPFVNTVYFPIATSEYITSITAFMVSVQRTSKSQMYIYCRSDSGGAVTGTYIYWIAIGSWK